MRLFSLLSVLSRQFKITLLNTALYRARQFNNSPTKLSGAPDIYRFCNFDVFSAPPPFHNETFDLIFVARVLNCDIADYYVKLFCNRRARLVLDVDDYESETRHSFARLAAVSGDWIHARSELAASRHFALQEKRFFSLYHRLLLSSSADVSLINSRFKSTNAYHVPNALANHPRKKLVINATSTFTLLFVGTMDYFPNVDGVVYFCNQILSAIRLRLCTSSVRVLIVGSRPTRVVRRLGLIPGVRVLGEVDDVSPYYSESDLLFVPLRAAGGTRIKILEAFSYGCPVVSTHIGAAGLEVTDDHQLLLADDPLDFAEACTRVLISAGLRRRLIGASASWLARNHSLESVYTSLVRAGVMS